MGIRPCLGVGHCRSPAHRQPAFLATAGNEPVHRPDTHRFPEVPERGVLVSGNSTNSVAIEDMSDYARGVTVTQLQSPDQAAACVARARRAVAEGSAIPAGDAVDPRAGRGYRRACGVGVAGGGVAAGVGGRGRRTAGGRRDRGHRHDGVADEVDRGSAGGRLGWVVAGAEVAGSPIRPLGRRSRRVGCESSRSGSSSRPPSGRRRG